MLLQLVFITKNDNFVIFNHNNKKTLRSLSQISIDDFVKVVQSVTHNSYPPSPRCDWLCMFPFSTVPSKMCANITPPIKISIISRNTFIKIAAAHALIGNYKALKITIDIRNRHNVLQR